jgi:hypothetical protein
MNPEQTTLNHQPMSEIPISEAAIVLANPRGFSAGVDRPIIILEQALDKLKNNAVCTRILKEIVIQHIYMFPVEYQIKQKLSELLNITMIGQRLMDQKKLGKA